MCGVTGERAPQSYASVGKFSAASVALAEDHRGIEAERWRSVALNVFCFAIGFLGLAVVVLWPPHLDLGWQTVLSVVFIGGFLAVSQRPTLAAGKSYAPLTAVIAASSIVFGYWTLFLVLTSFAAIRLRLLPRPANVADLFSPRSFGQAGAGISAVYAMIAVWSLFLDLQKAAPSWAASGIALVGVLVVGLVWQISQHGFVQVTFFFTRQTGFSLQFIRMGLFASMYGYLLVAMYGYGGMLTTVLFYVLVAQTRVVQDILGVVRRLEQLEQAKAQATSVIREVIRFTDIPDVQFTGEVENISKMLARHLGLSKKEIADIGLAAELHEIGKSRLPARIRWGRSSNASEENQRKTYARLGAIMLRSADALVDPVIADYVEYHSEHFDGTGYPKGLVGEAIPQASRVIAIARAYVSSLTGYDGVEKVRKEEALRKLRQESGTLFDPRLVDLLTEVVS